MQTCSRCGRQFIPTSSDRVLCPGCQMLADADEAAAAVKNTNPGKADPLTILLSEGWQVVGYSTTAISPTIIAHSVLLQRAFELRSVTVPRSVEKGTVQM